MDIIAENLEKNYPDFHLGPLNFKWEHGLSIALIGGNGAGKSTLFQILSGQATASNGQILLDQSPMNPTQHELKKRLGYLPQNLSLPPWSTPLEVIHYVQHLHQSKKDAMELLELWDCLSFAKKPLNLCSHGMHKRVGLALCTLHDPEILILDEPFSGLDLYHLKTLHKTLENRQRNGFTTILSTHIAPYAARYTQDAWHMKQGQIQHVSSWKDMKINDRIQLMEETFSL